MLRCAGVRRKRGVPVFVRALRDTNQLVTYHNHHSLRRTCHRHHHRRRRRRRVSKTSRW